MSIRLKYETKAGEFSPAETYLQINEHFRLLQEACAAMGHYNGLNGDHFTERSWIVLSEHMQKMNGVAQLLATKGMVAN